MVVWLIYFAGPLGRQHWCKDSQRWVLIRQHIVDVGRRSDLRDIGVLFKSGQRDRVNVMTERAQTAGHRLPEPGAYPGTGNRDKFLTQLLLVGFDHRQRAALGARFDAQPGELLLLRQKVLRASRHSSRETASCFGVAVSTGFTTSSPFALSR
jgi:hypothetical protein